MYTLGEVHDEERGWGRAGETWRIKDELSAYGAEPSWFALGDLDIGTHLVRTRMLDAGYPLSEVTAALCTRWQPGVTLLPMTDDRCETHVIIEEPPDAADPARARRKAVHFQEWSVRLGAAPSAQGFVQVGLDDAEPAPGVLEAILGADVVLIAPSNPVVSIGTILGLAEIREAVASGPAPVVGLSPIVAGAAVRGVADACLPAIGVDVSAEGVGRHYGARADGGLLDGWLVDISDEADVPGVEVRPVPLLMTDDVATAAMVKVALEIAL
jgi:LPPG:FO 2-phospho-L-lactate transferase